MFRKQEYILRSERKYTLQFKRVQGNIYERRSPPSRIFHEIAVENEKKSFCFKIDDLNFDRAN